LTSPLVVAAILLVGAVCLHVDSMILPVVAAYLRVVGLSLLGD
jgi:hypothetical protein